VLDSARTWADDRTDRRADAADLRRATGGARVSAALVRSRVTAAQVKDDAEEARRAGVRAEWTATLTRAHRPGRALPRGT
jgi:hypothetical protein